MTEDYAKYYLASIIKGLKRAHSQDVYHSDISPDNVLLTSDGKVKIADLGISKVLLASDKDAKFKQLFGKPLYMPPEAHRLE